jgi:ATPase subunit of ABC transporter with duplicated ATPase domains
MSALLTLDSVAAQTPEHRLLFSGLSLALQSERVGLVGRNGSGKSTLLRIVSGETAPAAGSVRVSGNVGTLVQAWPPDITVAEALGLDEPLALLQRIATGEGEADDFAAADWTLEPRLEAAFAEVGLGDIGFDRAMGSLSGGERTRVGIARLLVEKPELLLLDEPTNNLDADGRAAIHGLIGRWSGGILVASHDRAVLEAMDRIVELTPVGVRIVGGGWSAFAAQREREREAAADQLERTEGALREARRTAQRRQEAQARRDKAGRAFAAKGSEPKILLGAQARRAEETSGRTKRLGEREVSAAETEAGEARARVEVLTPIAIDLPKSGTPSNTRLLTLDQVAVDFRGRTLGPWSLEIRGPERVAVEGPNGSGKTTLLKVATGAIAPAGGTVVRAEKPIVLLDQHVELLAPQESIVANFCRLNPLLGEREAYAASASFGFRNRNAEQLVGTLSGGERLRAGLACTLAGERPPWLLILDEPTNHLDLESIELLERALREFDGGLLVVSHDRAFLEAIGIERRFNVAAHPAPTG